ncbi:MAG: Rne/Rng family ribonuclease [Candidatus Sumerlaeia bacterium]|nr:Rne/Rng family ribonuclease [Candidatus Sumerlaeia bacterium]
MQKRVIVNLGDTDVRVAFLEDGKLVEYHRESLTERSIVGNIYRGRVQDVIPGLQAAFIEVGMGRNVFLHFMDVRSEALVLTAENLDEALLEASKTVIPGRIVTKGRRPRPDPRAHDVPPPLKAGDTIIVQVIKAEIKDKAPRVTTNVALAGRYMVLLPYPSQTGGVSRRVALGAERVKLKKLLHELKSDKDSFIVRTAGVEAEEEQIRADVENLRETWQGILQKFRSMKGPGLVYSDQDFIQRLVRDVFTEDIDEIVCDDADVAEGLRLGLETTMPKLADRVIDYDGQEPIFHHYLVEAQLRKALHRKVWLKSGGYLIIDEMEALTAIDVNTGRYIGTKDQEKTTLRTNMEACEAVAQQIRLRDIGGIIVIDFIDMLTSENQNKVNEELRRHLRPDRAKMSIGRIGDFGLMILTRKRKHESLQKNVFNACPYCEGDGMVLKASEAWRRIRDDLAVLLGGGRKKYAAVVVTCAPPVAAALRGDFANHVARFEHLTGVAMLVREVPDLHIEDYTVTGVEMPRQAGVRIPLRRLSEEETMAADVAFEELPDEDVADLLNEPEPVAAPAPKPQLARPAAPRPERPAAQKPAVPAGRPARPAAVQPVEPVATQAVSPAEPGEAPAGETPTEAEERRRTRRGRRGGRRRRRGGRPEEVAAAANGATPADSDVEGDEAEESVEQPAPTTATIETIEPPTPVAATPARPPRPPRERPAPAAPPPPRPVAPVIPVASLPAKPRKVQILSQWGNGQPKTGEAPAAPPPPAAPKSAPPAAPVTPRPVRSIQIVSSWGGGSKPQGQGQQDVTKPGGTPVVARRAPSRAERRRQREESEATAEAPSILATSPDPAAVPAPTPEPPAEALAPAAEKKSARPRRLARKAPEPKKADPPPPAPKPVAAKPAAKKAAAKAVKKAAVKKATPEPKPQPAAKKAAAKKAAAPPAAKKAVKKAAAKKAARKSK